MDSSLVFAGDLSLHHSQTPAFQDFPSHLLSKKVSWCLNLEGAVSAYPVQKALYNTPMIVEKLAPLNISHLFLANNHIYDVHDGLSQSVQFCQQRNIQPVGVCSNKSYLDNSLQPLLLGYGWPVIGCMNPKETSHLRIQLLKPGSVKNDILYYRSLYPNRSIYIIFHANYELDSYPQPLHRDLARYLIDLGVAHIFFHHSHVVGPIESYKKSFIFYGLGNWIASRGAFFGGEHVYPPACNHRIAVEVFGDKVLVHEFTTDDGITIRYLGSSDPKDLALHCRFHSFSSYKYVSWYSHNKRRSFLLPTFKDELSEIIIFKEFLCKLRTFFILVLVKYRLKSPTPSRLDQVIP